MIEKNKKGMTVEAKSSLNKHLRKIKVIKKNLDSTDP